MRSVPLPSAVILAVLSAGCAHGSRSVATPPTPPAGPSEGDVVLEPAPPPPDAARERDDAVLLGTLIAGTPSVRWSVGNLGVGVATLATAGTFSGFATVYLARGGSFTTAGGPLLFGVGGTALGVYQLANGSDFARIQLDLGLALNRGDTPRMIIDEFEPRLREASYRARSRRHWFAGTNLFLSALSIAAGSFLIAARPEELRSSAYPSVLFGLAAIDALAALTTLVQPTPIETAWESYLHLASH